MKLVNTHSVYLPDSEATEEIGRALGFATSNLSVTEAQQATIAVASLGGCIYLIGELGAGKTTLVRGLMRGFGYTGAVKSPTYTLVEPYEFPTYNIYHFDLYRLSVADEVEYLGVESYFQTQNLCLFEWPERGGKAIPAPDLVITINIEATGRKLEWQAESPRGCEIAERLMQISRIL